MIKFSYETIREARSAVSGTSTPWITSMPITDNDRAAAAVFEAAANAQVGAVTGYGGSYWPSCTNENTRAGVDGALLPGALPDEPAKSATAPFKGMHTPGELDEIKKIHKVLSDAFPRAESGTMTDEALSEAMLDAYGAEHGHKEGVIAMARKARELLGSKHDENAACVIADLTQQVAEWKARAEAAEQDEVTCGFKVRAERAEALNEALRTQLAAAYEHAGRAEAAIERARAIIETALRKSNVTASLNAVNVAHILGLTITPARELTVTWEGGE